MDLLLFPLIFLFGLWLLGNLLKGIPEPWRSYLADEELMDPNDFH